MITKLRSYKEPDYDLLTEHLIENFGLQKQRTDEIRRLADDFKELDADLDERITKLKRYNEKFGQQLDEEQRKVDETNRHIEQLAAERKVRDR